MSEETIAFEIRLDASDELDDGNTIAEQFGIAPQLATLELMVHPKERERARPGGRRAARLARRVQLHARAPTPPLVLFIWGRKRVMPVNINSDATSPRREYSADLNPMRATVRREPDGDRG